MTASKGRRVTDIQSDKVKTLLASLKNGAYLQTACTYAGLGESTVHRWLERGRNENAKIEAGEKPTDTETPYLELWESIEKARAEATLRNLTLIQTAAQNGTWTAAAWYLERTNPALYGRRNFSEVTGANGGALEINLTADELNAKIATIMGEVLDESGETLNPSV